MQILWKYLKPYKWLAIFSMVLAAISQALNFLDPVIFGKILDNYALNPGGRTEKELVTGVLGLLALAIGVAIASKAAKSFQEYVLRIVVQKFGKNVFDDGLNKRFGYHTRNLKIKEVAKLYLYFRKQDVIQKIF